MFGHLPELFIILVIALVVFGPEKLPEVAANAGKMMREVREVLDTAMNPVEHDVPEDFSAYYYESLARAGEDVPPVDGEGDEDPEAYYGADHDFVAEHDAGETLEDHGVGAENAGHEAVAATDTSVASREAGTVERDRPS